MNTQRPDDSKFSAWLDGEVDATTKAEVEHWLRDHPDDAQDLRLWAADRDALRARFDPVADEPVPERLLSVVRRSQRSGWRRLAAAAAMVAGGAALGAGLAWQFAPPEGVVIGRPIWTHRAAVAHAVYAPEVRHPVEVFTAEGSAAEQRAQEEHLTRWLTKRLDMPVRIFDLREQGFALIGGRLLPDASGPSAQLMYQNGEGQRVTIYLRKPEPGTDSAFRFQRDGELAMFYWIDEGLGCALVGKLPRERLLALAEAVYKQSEAQGGPQPRPRPPA